MTAMPHRSLGFTAFLLMVIVGSAPAEPLNLSLVIAPDIFSSFIDVSYDAGSDTLTAAGFALELDDDGVGPGLPIVGGAFQLSAPISSSGVLGAGGTLIINGTIASLGFNSGTLLTGTVTDFGFRPSGGDPLEFLIEVTGGDAASLYGVSGTGVILVGTGFPGTFVADFDNLLGGLAGTGAGAADVAPVPPELPPGGERSHPGWNRVDCQILLTANQPTYWSTLTGRPGGCQPFTVLDPGIPSGRPDPDSPTGERMLRGYVLAWAVDNRGHEIRWDHLTGSATVVHYGLASAWEYNAYAFQALSALHAEPTDAVPGQLKLDGVEYERGFARLGFDFLTSGSLALSNVAAGNVVFHDTGLTLLPVTVDLRQDTLGPVSTKARFDIWNANEVRFSGTQRCITCWDQTLLSRYDQPNHFLRANLQTDRGMARIDGVASSACPFSVDAPLLGVAVRQLAFTRGNSIIGFDHAAVTLRGQGWEDASIRYDVISPPDELITGTGPAAVGMADAWIERSPDPTTNAVPASSHDGRGSVSVKGSLLVFPQVEIRWNAAGTVIQDTFVEITNDYPSDVFIQLYFINGDPPLEAAPVIGGTP